MASIALRADRVMFSSSSNFDTEESPLDGSHANVLCSLIASAAGLVTLTGEAGAGTARLTGLAAPTAAGDAVSAGYLAWKAPVRAVTSTALTGMVTYDAGVITGPTGTEPGVEQAGPLTAGGTPLVEGDRVLISGQGEPNALQNGIYTVTTEGATGTAPYVLTRAFDFDTGATVQGAAVVVQEGASAGKLFCMSGDAVVGTDSVTFAEIGRSAGPVTINPHSITLSHLQNGDSGGQLLYYGGSVPYSAARLDIGTEGLPLVAGATVPQYAELTGAGLATAIYKTDLIIGDAEGGEYISFATTDAVDIFVGGFVKLSATTGGGAFTGTWSGSSDEKWKELLGPISADPLGDLDKVESQTWTWKAGYHFGDAGAFGAGIVAQQFQLVCPRAVTFSAEQDGLVVDYNAVHSFNLACIKALKAENAGRQAENAVLEQANAALAGRVASLEQDASDLKARLALLEAAFHSHAHP